MKRLLKLLLFLLAVIGVGAAAFPGLHGYWSNRNKVVYRELPVTSGDIASVVNSTGTVQPVLRVQIGSFVSGPVCDVEVDFNSVVKKGDVLAKIDPRTFQAAIDRDEATLSAKQAEVERLTALLQQAVNDQKRAEALRATKTDFISDTEMDQFKFSKISLAAQLKLAEAAVRESKAMLSLSKANLDYTTIKSSVDGIVISRTVDPGQTVAGATLQATVLFIVAPEMDKKMFVYASVDEADIGLIREAQSRHEPVNFTVDAYPDDLFSGWVRQVRLNPLTTQNVVTYTVVVEAPNHDLKLLPGMTANLSFQIEKRASVLKIPNAALRFYPKPNQVRPEDRLILDGGDATVEAQAKSEDVDTRRTASEQVAAARDRNRHHVWVLDGDYLRAVAVTTGMSDSNFTELVDGPLTDGQKLVTGVHLAAGL